MNGASVSLHSHSLFRFQPSSSFATSSSSYPISPNFKSSYPSISNRIRQSLRAVLNRRNDGFRSFAVKKRSNGGSGVMESDGEEEDDDDAEAEDEDWGDFDVEGEGDGEDEEEGEFLPMDKMKQWLERKPRGFGVGRKYETSIEDKLLDEIEQSWKAQAANLNKLKNDPIKPQQKKGAGETPDGFRVRVTNLPRKKNVHRDLKAAFKEVSGILNIAPAVSGNKKTKDPVCKGFGFVYFRTEIDANRFVEQFSGERLAFGKVIKQIKCQVVDSSSNQSDSEDEDYSNKGFSEEQESRLSGLDAVSNADVVVEDAFLDSWEESDDSDRDVDEQNVISSSVESPIELRRDLRTDLKSRKQVVKQEIREHAVESETPLVSLQGKKSEDAAAEIRVHDQLDNVAEENLEPVKSSIASTDEQRIERIRMLELKLLGRGAESGQAEAKPSSRVEGNKTTKKKKKKIVVKGQGKKSSKIEIPGSSKRLKVKEKALLTGVLEKYAARVASTSNDK